MAVVNGHPDKFIASPLAKCPHKHATDYACGWKLTLERVYVSLLWWERSEKNKRLFLEIVFPMPFFLDYKPRDKKVFFGN